MIEKILRFLVFCTLVFSCVTSWIGIYMFFHGFFFKNPEEMDRAVFFAIPIILVLLFSPILCSGEENE